MVNGYGPRPASILLIGEAPGAQELREGRPFVGRSGQLLDTLLLEAGLTRGSIRITNSCACVDMAREDKRPLPAELEACRPRLEQEIDITRPNVILCMGNIALQRFWPGMRIGEIYNSMRQVGQMTVVALYHPAAALRNPHLCAVIVDGLKAARRLNNGIIGSKSQMEGS